MVRFKFVAVFLSTTLFYVFGPILQVQAAPDNKGTEYIIGYMENVGWGSADPLNPELYVTTMKTTTVNVQVTAPLYTNNVIDESFTVIAGEVKKLSFDSDFRVTGSTLSNKGLWIQADQEIVVYGVSPETYSNDAFLGIPTDVVGTEYYVITWYPATNQCELLVVGVNDSTTVNILLSQALGSSTVTYNGNTYSAGDTIVVNINRYQTLQLTSSGDLTGSYITSDKRVSVFSGNKKTTVTYTASSDHLVEQWPPVSTFGKSFATVPIPGRTVGDKFKIVASEDNTDVTVTGSGSYSTSFTLSTAGSLQELDIGSGEYCYIHANKPILVAQICKSQQSRGTSEKSDPMMVMIPPIELFAADYTFATPEYSQSGDYTNYFMFVVKDSEKSGLLVDGASFPGSTTYNSIPGTDLVGGYIEVSHGTHTVRHTLTTSVFGAYLFGTATYETYGFPTGSRFAPINSVCSTTTSETGDGIDNDCDGLIDEESCPDGVDDDGDGSTDEDCATPFPIDGVWTDWTVWSSCSVTCSETGSLVSGTQIRTRTCTNPAPQYDGQQCSGDSNETLSCSTSTQCPATTTTAETTTTEMTTTTTTPESTSTSTSTTTTPETTSTSTSTTTTPETTSTSTSTTTTPETTSTSTSTTTTPETTSTSTSTTTTPETTSTSTSTTTTPETTSTSASTTTTPETTSTSTSTTTTPETTSTSTSTTTTPETTSTSTSTTTTPETTTTSTSTTTTPETTTTSTSTTATPKTTTTSTSTTTTPETTKTSTSTTTTPETTTMSTSTTTTPETTTTSTSTTTSPETTSTSTSTTTTPETTTMSTSTTTTAETTTTSTSTTTTPETTSTSTSTTTEATTSTTTTPETTSTSTSTTTEATTSTAIAPDTTSTTSTTTTTQGSEEAVALSSTAAETITETMLAAIITCSILGPCAALSAMFALRKRLLKSRKQVKPSPPTSVYNLGFV